MPMRATIVALALLATLPARADELWGTIVYAQVPWSAKIISHEIGHIACPQWRHPPHLKADGTDYRPPAGCTEGAFRARGGLKIRRIGLSLEEARDSCGGSMGCAISPEIQRAQGLN